MRSHKPNLCIYCGSLANEREHVPPRCLLEKPYPSNLKTLPVCAHCNRGFAKDEEYFIVLLSQIGTSETLTKKVSEGGSVDRAMKQSPRLEDRILNSLTVDQDGRIIINPDLNRVGEVVRKIALGLFVLRYKKVPQLHEFSGAEVFPYNIEDRRPIATFVSTYSERFRSKKWTVVQPKVFSYIFVKQSPDQQDLCCIIDFHSTAWGVVYTPLPKRANASNDTQIWFPFA